jgi:hypothetical protein
MKIISVANYAINVNEIMFVKEIFNITEKSDLVIGMTHGREIIVDRIGKDHINRIIDKLKAMRD